MITIGNKTKDSIYLKNSKIRTEVTGTGTTNVENTVQEEETSSNEAVVEPVANYMSEEDFSGELKKIESAATVEIKLANANKLVKMKITPEQLIIVKKIIADLC